MGTGFIISGWVLSGGKSYPGRGVEGKHGNSPEVEPGSGWAASGPEGQELLRWPEPCWEGELVDLVACWVQRVKQEERDLESGQAS